jgi:aryl-alcohol dehydrogenase-like predicted oxidoreductase
MKYRTLGGTDIVVSEVGFGVWTVSTGWWGEVDDERSVRLLCEARERGINYFDTADTYGSGKESRSSQMLSGTCATRW